LDVRERRGERKLKWNFDFAQMSASPLVSASGAPVVVAAASSVAAPAIPAPVANLSIGELARGGAQLIALSADLAAINSCAYCLLRFANVRQEKAFLQSKEWLQQYTRGKLGWPHTWSLSGCPLCLDTLGSTAAYWNSVIETALRDQESGEWKFELDQFSLNISEPILAKIRQYAAGKFFSQRYSRLQNGLVDLKDALKWQFSNLFISATGGRAKFSPIPCELGFLLALQTEVPAQEYDIIVSTLPKNEHAAARRAPGDFAVPLSNNPVPVPIANVSEGHARKRGKKNPRQDAMGQKTVTEALPKVQSEVWKKLDIFEPVRRNDASKASAAAAAAAAASTAADSAMATANPANHAAAASSDSSAASMDTSSSAAPRIPIPVGYSLSLSCLVPFPTLDFIVHRQPVLLCGYYRKFYRCLSQSVWKLGDKKMLGAAGTVKPDRSALDSTLPSSSEDAVTSAASDDDDDADADADADVDVDVAADDDYGSGDDDDEECLVGRRMTDSSVEEEIVREVLQHFQAKEYKFHSSGREDMDVRMLGNGRMFFLEFMEARRVPKSARAIEAACRDLSVVALCSFCLRSLLFSEGAPISTLLSSRASMPAASTWKCCSSIWPTRLNSHA
jgi:hypothetical protein